AALLAGVLRRLGRQHRLALGVEVHRRLALGVAAAPQEAARAADALQHRLAARRTLHVRLHRLRPRLLALHRLDVAARFLLAAVAGAADDLAPKLLAVVAPQVAAALRTLLARLDAVPRRHLLLRRPQRLRERSPELVQHLVVLHLPRLDLVQLLL